MENILERIEENHRHEILEIFKTVGWKNIFSGKLMMFSFFLTILFFACGRCYLIDYQVLLVKIIDINLTLFPTMIGFLAAAQAFYLASDNDRLIEIGVKFSGFSAKTLFQAYWAFMSFMIIAFTLVTIISFVLSFVVSEKNVVFGVIPEGVLSFCFHILFLLSFYSICLIFQVVQSAFVISQVKNLYVTMKVYNEMNFIIDNQSKSENPGK